MLKRVLLCGLAMSALVAADAPDDLAAKFGAMPSVMDISLSPDGSRIAYLAPQGDGGVAVYTVNLSDHQAKTVLSTAGKGVLVYECGWVSNDRLVCNVLEAARGAGRVRTAGKLYAVDANGGGSKMLTYRDAIDRIYTTNQGGNIIDWLPDENGAVLMTRRFVPEGKVGSLIEKRAEGLGVERVDTVSLRRSIVETAKREGYEFISDQHGNVRVMGSRPFDLDGYWKPEISYFYRAAGAKDWTPLASYNAATDEGFNPYAIDRDQNIVYGYRKLDGRKALYAKQLDGSLSETLVLSDAKVDVGSLIRIGRDHHVVGAWIVRDEAEPVYFDKSVKALVTALSRALPQNPSVQAIDASADGGRMLMWAGSDVDPGGYYVFDKAQKQLNKIMLGRNELEGVAIAETKAVQYPASDGTMVPAYLTVPRGSSGKNLPAIVMPHGGPSSRDAPGFDWLSAYFVARGYAVLRPNFRGSTGYGDSWLVSNGFRSWRTSINDVVDAGKWLNAQGIAAPGKLAVFGWSYGGYAALQSAVVAPELFKAVIAVAPVTDFRKTIEEDQYFVSGRDTRASISGGDDMDAGSPAQHAGNIGAPVMLFHGDMDTNVDIEQSRLMATKLKGAGKNYLYVEYPGLAHSLESSVARSDMLRRSDAFLREQMGIK